MTETIELRLHTIKQLFQSLDPAPFHDKDLDPDAVAYIVGRARDLPHDSDLTMTVEFPASEADMPEARGLEAAVRGYFAWREELAWRDLRLRLAEGRQALVIGLLFLGACTLARELLRAATDNPWLAWIEEGLTIVGWIAMWHPIDTFLYRWWPIRREARLYARLARMRVTPRPVAPPL
ncbi:MAG: hypothetical protein ACKO1J_20805 [Tagaea sp.]